MTRQWLCESVGRAALLSAILLANAGGAAAQTADTTTDQPVTTTETSETVIVTAPHYVPKGSITATKTTMPLIKTPQSVSVITRDQIDLLNFIDVQQAVRYTAGIVGENYGPDRRYDFLTQRGFIPTQYIDGLLAPVSASIINNGVDLYGFQEVDVLKGPSASLYGSSPPGGIYNLTSRRPTDEFGGEVRAIYGSHDFKEIAGTVSAPINDWLDIGLTGLFRNASDEIDYLHTERTYIAPVAKFTIDADTTLSLLGYYQKDHNTGDPNGFLPAAGTLDPNPNGTVSRHVNLGEPDYNRYDRNQISGGFEFSHRFNDWLGFTSNARWSHYEEAMLVVYGSGLEDDDRTVTRSNFPFDDNVNQFTIDSRFDAKFDTGAFNHHVIAGLDYRLYRETSVFGFSSAPSIDLFDPVYDASAIVTPALDFTNTNQKLRQTGAYIQDQISYENWVLTLTGRQDWTEQTNFATADHPSTDADKFTYRAGLTYVFDNGIAPYVSYATSFQPTVGADFAGDVFKPTTGDQIEAGVKYDARTLPDGIKLFASAALYQIHQKNVVTADPDHAFFNIQAGEVEVTGFELEGVARFNEQLSVNASYTYADAKVDRSSGPDLDARLPEQPKNKLSLFVDYTLQTGDFRGLGFGFGGRYLSSQVGSLPTIFSPTVLTTPSVTLFDAAIHYDMPDWRFSLNASNLFDKRYVARCSGEFSCFYGAGQELMVTVTRKF